MSEALANQLLQQGYSRLAIDPESARVKFADAAALAPRFDVYRALGMAALAMGDLEGSRLAFATAAELVADDPWIWAMLGTIHERQGNAVAAARAWKNVTGISRRDAEAWFHRALALERAGQPRAAQRAQERARRLYHH